MAPWNLSCDWCGVSMGYDESFTSEKEVDYGGGVTVTYHVCYKCRKFPTEEARNEWFRIQLVWAQLRYRVTLDKVTYAPPDATIYYTIHYEDEDLTVKEQVCGF